MYASEWFFLLIVVSVIRISISFDLNINIRHERLHHRKSSSIHQQSSGLYNEDSKYSSVGKLFNIPSAEKVGLEALRLVSNLAEYTVISPNKYSNETQRNIPITSALQRIKSNMDMLDNVAGRTPQLGRLELGVLVSTVVISALSPFFLSINIVEVLVPSMAAISASIGLSAEYVGKVEVSKSKEISALAIQAAAESEVLLATAERTKAILPLCVGIATTSSAFSLMAPTFIQYMSKTSNFQIISEFLLICPLVAVLAACIAGLATRECQSLARRASDLGSRRFASSSTVGRSWLSITEQVEMSSLRLNQKWITFAVSVLPAPILAGLFPGSLEFKAVVCTAVAAAQAAYYLAVSEYFISSSVEAVALKARASAVADTYANQGARAGAILPFTSALASLCAAGSAAVVELLPLIHNAVELQSLIAVIFPTGAALFAAAASVAKARCEVGESFLPIRIGY